MSVMLVLDFIFGIASAKNRGEEIKSSIRQKGLVKKITRWTLPFIVAGGLARTGMQGINLLVDAIIGMIIFSELYSIIGHIYSINYGQELPELDAFKMLLESLTKILKKLVNKTNDELNKEE